MISITCQWEWFGGNSSLILIYLARIFPVRIYCNKLSFFVSRVSHQWTSHEADFRLNSSGINNTNAFLVIYMKWSIDSLSRFSNISLLDPLWILKQTTSKLLSQKKVTILATKLPFRNSTRDTRAPNEAPFNIDKMSVHAVPMGFPSSGSGCNLSIARSRGVSLLYDHFWNLAFSRINEYGGVWSRYCKDQNCQISTLLLLMWTKSQGCVGKGWAFAIESSLDGLGYKALAIWYLHIWR